MQVNLSRFRTRMTRIARIFTDILIPCASASSAQSVFHRGCAMISNKVLDEAARRIVEKFHPEKIILFGSQARGTADSHSDVDILEISAIKEKRRKLMVDMHQGKVRSFMSIPDQDHINRVLLWMSYADEDQDLANYAMKMPGIRSYRLIAFLRSDVLTNI